MSYESIIARRYIFQKRKFGFITFITYISIIGLAIGVAALIITLSVLNGFENTVKEKIADFESHIKIRSMLDWGIYDKANVIEAIKTSEEVVSYFPYIEKEALIKYQNFNEGVKVKGINEQDYKKIGILETGIVQGEFEVDETEKEDRSVFYSAVIGKNLAERTGVSLNDRIFLISPSGFDDKGSKVPVVKQFRIKGIFDSGMYEYDNTYIFVSMEAASDLFGFDDNVTGFEIKVRNVKTADEVSNFINRKLKYPCFANSFYSTKSILFAWMKVQKRPILLVFGMIVVVGGFNLISTLIMMILEKRKDIGILKSMGASGKGVMKIFFYEGLFIGAGGTIIGGLLAFLIILLQYKYKFITISKEVYFVESLPVSLDITNFIVIGSITILLSMAATLYPSWRASSIPPADAVRIE